MERYGGWVAFCLFGLGRSSCVCAGQLLALGSCRCCPEAAFTLREHAQHQAAPQEPRTSCRDDRPRCSATATPSRLHISSRTTFCPQARCAHHKRIGAREAWRRTSPVPRSPPLAEKGLPFAPSRVLCEQGLDDFLSWEREQHVQQERRYATDLLSVPMAPLSRAQQLSNGTRDLPTTLSSLLLSSHTILLNLSPSLFPPTLPCGATRTTPQLHTVALFLESDSPQQPFCVQVQVQVA